MKKRTVILLLLQVVVLLLLVAAAAFKAIEITPSSHPVLYKELEHIANTFAQQNVKDFNVKYRLEEILIQYPNSPEVLQLYGKSLLVSFNEVLRSDPFP